MSHSNLFLYLVSFCCASTTLASIIWAMLPFIIKRDSFRVSNSSFDFFNFANMISLFSFLFFSSNSMESSFAASATTVNTLLLHFSAFSIEESIFFFFLLKFYYQYHRILQGLGRPAKDLR
eukprot:GHVP01020575.1.p1 GENE.GHVP01020575.1~~GHVP01020575.1.p1  ORF type:complete len:121 (+),score=15.76 GHVP01020575.1:45-407(+)